MSNNAPDYENNLAFDPDVNTMPRCDYWDKGQYIQLKEDGYIYDDKDDRIEVSNLTILGKSWELYKKPEPVWDSIIKNKCLCFFWDEWFGAACIGILGEIYKECDLKYVLRDENGNQSQFRNCRPIRRDEVTFYEDKKE